MSFDLADYKDVPQRIAERIHVSEQGCWEWQGKRLGASRGGYAAIYHDRKEHRGHRLVYELVVGPIPPGLTLDHLCRVRHCVNPAHLEPVTLTENRRRAAATVTHCKRGHSLDDAYITTKGHRDCRTCRLGGRT